MACEMDKEASAGGDGGLRLPKRSLGWYRLIVGMVSLSESVRDWERSSRTVAKLAASFTG